MVKRGHNCDNMTIIWKALVKANCKINTNINKSMGEKIK